MLQQIFLSLSLFLIFPAITSAQVNADFIFKGQASEHLVEDKNITVVTPEVVQVPSTCSRQVADGERRVCNDVLRYRQSCSWIPSREECRTTTSRVCRPVTRTRQECSNGPSRQECSTSPRRQVCTDGPRGRHCTEVGGERSCRTVPGARSCRTVTYTDQDCQSVPRRQCHTVPGRNHCESIPYYENVCHYETQYRTDYYSCMKPETIYNKEDKVLRVAVDVKINTNGNVEEIPMRVSVQEVNQEFKNFNFSVKLLNEPNLLVIVQHKKLELVGENDQEIILQGEVVIELHDKNMLPLEFPESIQEVIVNKNANTLLVVFNGSLSGNGSVEGEMTHKAFLSKTKTIFEFKDDYPSELIGLEFVGERIGLSIHLGDDVVKKAKKNMKLNLKLKSGFDFQGEVLNSQKPVLSKEFQNIKVNLK